MKVLFFAVGDFKEGNGANSRFVCYGKGFNHRRIENKFYFIVPSEFNDSGINTKFKGHHLGIEFEYLSKTTHRSKNIFGRILILFKSWYNAHKLFKTIDKTKNVLYFYGPQAFILGPIIVMAKLRGFKIVIENTEFQTLRNEGDNFLVRWLSRWFSAIFERQQASLTSDMVVISRRLLRFNQQRFPEARVHLIPIVYEKARFKDIQLPHKAYRLGYLGSFGQKDGVPGIIEAFQQVRQKIPNLKLRLIGYQIRSSDVKRAFAQYHLSTSDPHLEITGQVMSSEIPQLLADCDVLLLNRIDTPYANYGFATKLGEYLATGRPVISSNVSDVSHYLQDGENIRIINPGDSSELAAAILERYEEYEKYDVIGANGKERAEHLFSYQQHVDKIIDICSNALNWEHKKTDPVQRIGFSKGERPGSNRRPLDPQTSALTN